MRACISLRFAVAFSGGALVGGNSYGQIFVMPLE
jgi:hypothetical protein